MFLFVNWNVNPELFRIGGFGMRYYSLLFAGAFYLGFLIMRGIYRRENRSERELSRLLVYLLVGTVLGARLGQAFFYEFGYFKDHPLEIILPFRYSNGGFTWTGYQGLASHGGALGVLAAILLFSRRFQWNVLDLLDRLVIPVALAASFIRLGNLFNSEIIGKPSQLPWAFVFQRVDPIPRHPAQLYESICYGAIFVFLLWYFHRPLKPSRGRTTGWFLVLLFSVRFAVEFLKENQAAFENSLPVNMGQLLSLPFMVGGLVLLLRKQKENVKEAP